MPRGTAHLDINQPQPQPPAPLMGDFMAEPPPAPRIYSNDGIVATDITDSFTAAAQSTLDASGAPVPGDG